MKKVVHNREPQNVPDKLPQVTHPMGLLWLKATIFKILKRVKSKSIQLTGYLQHAMLATNATTYPNL